MARYTKFNSDQASATLTALESEAPSDTEISNTLGETASYLEGISAEHDNFLSSYISELNSGGDLYDQYLKANNEYNNLINSLSTAIEEYNGANTNGSVSYSNYSTTTSTSVNSDSTTSDSETKSELTDTNSEQSLTDELTNTNSEQSLTDELTNTNPEQSISDEPTNTNSEQSISDEVVVITNPTETTVHTNETNNATQQNTPTTTGGGYTRSGGYRSSSYTNSNNDIDTTDKNTKISPLKETKTSIDDIVKGTNRKYNQIPKSTSVINKQTSKGGSAVIPIAAGVAAAAAAGIGAKAYIDRKKNNDNGENTYLDTDDWDENSGFELDNDTSSDKKEETLLNEEYTS